MVEVLSRPMSDSSSEGESSSFAFFFPEVSCSKINARFCEHLGDVF